MTNILQSLIYKVSGNIRSAEFYSPETQTFVKVKYHQVIQPHHSLFKK